MKPTEAANRILELDKEATPGPWLNEDERTIGNQLPWRSTGLIWNRDYREAFPFGKAVAQCVEKNIPKNDKDLPEAKEFEADASFIAESRTLAPQVATALLQAIETLNKIATHLDGVKSECYASQYTINDDDMEAVYFCRDIAQEFLKEVEGD